MKCYNYVEYGDGSYSVTEYFNRADEMPLDHVIDMWADYTSLATFWMVEWEDDE